MESIVINNFIISNKTKKIMLHMIIMKTFIYHLTVMLMHSNEFPCDIKLQIILQGTFDYD